jgi:alkylhydroperoxidase family enzyme
MADCRAIANFKQQKKTHIETKSGLGKKSLALHFEEINPLKRQLKPEKTTSNKKRKAESILSTEMNKLIKPLVVTKERARSIFNSSKLFTSGKTKLEKSLQPATELVVSSKSHCQPCVTSAQDTC